MTTTNDGGPAFPFISGVDDDETHYSGMSLRDWFAGMALQGHLASYAGPECTSPKPERAAQECYAYADAMLKARNP